MFIPRSSGASSRGRRSAAIFGLIAVLFLGTAVSAQASTTTPPAPPTTTTPAYTIPPGAHAGTAKPLPPGAKQSGGVKPMSGFGSGRPSSPPYYPLNPAYTGAFALVNCVKYGEEVVSRNWYRDYYCWITNSSASLVILFVSQH